MALDLPKSLSPSSVSTFKNCPQSFKFAYVDRLPQPASPAASKGTLVHKALEYLMLRPAPERTLDAALTDLDRARAALNDDPDFTGLDLNEAEWRSFQTEAEQLVRKYFELEDPRTVLPIGLELKLSAKVGNTTMRGIIDRLELDADGELVVTDYKTGSVPGELWENSRLGGVHMYALLCEQMLGRRPVRVQLLYLSKPEAIIATPTEQSIGGVERKTGALWTAIERACNLDDFRPKTGKLCDWCAYKAYCPAWGGDPERAVELRGAAALAPPLPLGTPVEPAVELLLPTG
ncbi:MAG: RecB family exonuclease [Actinomycetia bacterium]|nr:RecB family exonuclease [Actinomycetes bacterium]